jgi:hypothetical protein
LHVVVRSSPCRPGVDSGATGSPLGPGSAGWVTIVPVVSLLAAPSAVAAVSPNFGEVEQPAKQVRPARTRIRTRATRIHIAAPRTSRARQFRPSADTPSGPEGPTAADVQS